MAPKADEGRGGGEGGVVKAGFVDSSCVSIRARSVQRT